MTVSREPPQAEAVAPKDEPEQTETVAFPERPARQPRPRRQRPEANPALDPRLAQLERRSRRPSRAGDISLLFIGIAAFVFGVALHGWVVMAVLEDDGPAESAENPIAATATPDDDDSPSVTPTTPPQATPTTLPDRTSCDEIRGTQYRSVSEREFFLANCTSG
jgi:hypothetical protein